MIRTCPTDFFPDNTDHQTPKYVTDIAQIEQLSPQERQELQTVVEKFPFRANSYYLSLIDWNDPNDPIRRLIVPSVDELQAGGDLDPSGEVHYTVLPGLEHKYNSTALLLASSVCGAICRYCFRKRVFIQDHREILSDIPAAVEYIRQHTEITNVLLTGGDPLLLSTNKIRHIIQQIIDIDHVRIIRIGSKMPAFNPFRILNDPDLLNLIDECDAARKQMYFLTHFSHPRELTDAAKAAIKMLRRTGAVLTNQTPIIAGVNDDPYVLAELFRKLSFNGVPPYYVFQCRPALGNKAYAVPIEEAYQIFDRANSMVSGLAKRSRFVMSHVSGKIEVTGIDEHNLYLRYHRAADDGDSGKSIVARRNPDAYWFSDYEAVEDALTADLQHQS